VARLHNQLFVIATLLTPRPPPSPLLLLMLLPAWWVVADRIRTLLPSPHPDICVAWWCTVPD